MHRNVKERILLILLITGCSFYAKGIVTEGGINDCTTKDIKVYRQHAPENMFRELRKKGEVYGVFDFKTETLKIVSQQDMTLSLVCTMPTSFKDVALKKDNDILLENFFPGYDEVLRYGDVEAEGATLNFNTTHYTVDIRVNHTVTFASYSIYITESPIKIQQYHIYIEGANDTSITEGSTSRSAVGSHIVRTSYISGVVTLLVSTYLLHRA